MTPEEFARAELRNERELDRKMNERLDAERETVSDIEIDSRNPTIEQILEAVPDLNWRVCFGCQRTQLHSDNCGLAIKCRVCGSRDTRAISRANKVLHRTVPESPEVVDTYPAWCDDCEMHQIQDMMTDGRIRCRVCGGSV